MNKKTKIIFAEAKYEGRDKPVKFYLLVDPEKISSAPEEEVKRNLGEMLKVTRLDPAFGITRMFTSYSVVDKEDLKMFDYADVLVEAHLPYCLHLPMNYEMEVRLDNKRKALVTFQKFWTKKAKDDVRKSDEVDFYASDIVTYFQKGTILSPKFPVHPEEGWEQYVTGTNIEKEKDQGGTFRFTKVFIQFDPEIEEGKATDLEESVRDEILDNISNQALQIINRVIDTYRFVSKEEYVERLGRLDINNIYFLKENHGVYVLSIGHGIKTAVMNRSKEEIEEIEKSLDEGNEPPQYELLILDSHSALLRNAFTLAIVTSYQALEIMLENFLIEGFKLKNIPELEYQRKLNQFWKTKQRLTTLLQETHSVSLNDPATLQLWSRWCNSYSRLRNKVIHKGKEATKSETEDALKANEEVMVYLKNL